LFRSIGRGKAADAQSHMLAWCNYRLVPVPVRLLNTIFVKTTGVT